MPMKKMGLFDAKNRLSELVDRAAQGEEIGITRRGKLTAKIVPVAPKVDLREIFGDIEIIRKRAKLPPGLSVEELIEEGRLGCVSSPTARSPSAGSGPIR